MTQLRTAPPTAHELESSLEAHLNRQVRLLGGRTSKMVPADAGMPDRLVLLPGGRLYLVELKTSRGSVRPIQRVWHERAAQLGTTVVVLAGLGQINDWLRARAVELDGPQVRARRSRTKQ